MGIKDDLTADIQTIFRSPWQTTEKTVIPAPADLGLGNHAGHFDQMTVLYADLNGSTLMVDSQDWQISAEVYKAYLHCAAKVIKAEGGSITAYDGDRIMAVFVGNSKNTSAVRSALMTNTMVNDVINPALHAQYPTLDLTVAHSIGIDTSEIHVARIGVKNDNDLVWVGRAANHAAKLTTLPEFPIWISADVYTGLHDSVKISASSGANVWEACSWTAMNDRLIYRSQAYWNFG